MTENIRSNTCSTKTAHQRTSTDALSSSRCDAIHSEKSKETVEISDVGPFHFFRPIVFAVERFENSIVLSNTEADLFASGKTLDEAKADLQSEIGIAWEEYAMEEDSEMDSVAREYKRWLLANVKKCDRYDDRQDEGYRQKPLQEGIRMRQGLRPCTVYPYVDDIRTRIRTKMSHGENEIGDDLILKMSHQLKLSESGFMDLIRCPLSEEEYVKILRESDEIE